MYPPKPIHVNRCFLDVLKVKAFCRTRPLKFQFHRDRTEESLWLRPTPPSIFASGSNHFPLRLPLQYSLRIRVVIGRGFQLYLAKRSYTIDSPPTKAPVDYQFNLLSQLY